MNVVALEARWSVRPRPDDRVPVREHDFTLRSVLLHAPPPGSVLVQLRWLRLDDVVRTALLRRRPGEVVPCTGYGVVAASGTRADGAGSTWQAGDAVAGEFGLREWACVPAGTLRVWRDEAPRPGERVHAGLDAAPRLLQAIAGEPGGSVTWLLLEDCEFG